MKILAVSDAPSLSLETQVDAAPERFRDIDCIVSCGDLGRDYLDFIVDGLRKPFFFVLGNHKLEPDQCDLTKNVCPYAGGTTVLHGTAEAFGNYLIVGFSGSMWYNGKPNQYTEAQMTRLVKHMERKIKWMRLEDKLRRRKPKEVIVISHAPPADVHDQPDLAHRGFKCFHHFIQAVKPLVWMHGHIHLTSAYKNQVTLLDRTTVINVFSCKIVDIDHRQIDVHSHCSV